MILIGIAGGIGSGKSVVSRILRLRGYAVYDCDIEARRLMEDADGMIRRELCGRYGVEAYLADGSLDRRRLAGILFIDESERRWCDALVHSEVRRDFARWVGARRSAGDTVAFVESAIIAGSGLAAMCDGIWLVSAPEDVRIARAVTRGMDADDVRKRLQAQREEEKLLESSPTPVIRLDNSGDRHSLLAAIDSMAERMLG